MAGKIPAWMVENLGALKAAHHMDAIASSIKSQADQLDTLLLDMDGADDYTDLVSELESVAEYASELSKKLIGEISDA